MLQIFKRTPEKAVGTKGFIYFEAISFLFSWDDSVFYHWNEALTEFCTLSLVLLAKNKMGSTELCNLLICLMYPLKTTTFILKYFSACRFLFSLILTVSILRQDICLFLCHYRAVKKFDCFITNLSITSNKQNEKIPLLKTKCFFNLHSYYYTAKPLFSKVENHHQEIAYQKTFLRWIHNFGSLNFNILKDSNYESRVCNVNSPITNPKAECSAFDCSFLQKSHLN